MDVVDQNRRILIEADVGTVAAAMLFARAHDHGFHHRALLGGAVGRRLLHGSRNHVTQMGDRSGGTAQRQNHLQLARTGVVGDVEHASHHHCHNLVSLLHRMGGANATGLTRRLCLDGRYLRRARLNSPALPRRALSAPRAARFPSTATASIWRAAGSLPASRSRRDAPCRPRRGRRTFCCGPPRAYRTGGPFAAGLRPRWSWPSWWRPLRQSGSCDGRGSLLCWLLLLFRPWLTFSPSQPSCWPPSSPSLSSSPGCLRLQLRRYRPPALSGATPSAHERCLSSARGFSSGSRSVPSSTETSS